MEIADRVRWLENLSPTPANEAQTRLWVLDRVLFEDLGYQPIEVLPETPGATTGVPDYALLPGTPHQWWMEAKAWSVDLTDAHALQATTYAYQSGGRWVVVTNGRRWRLYDSQVVSAVPSEKLVADATPAEPQALAALLEALRAERVRAGGLAAFARRSLLERFLRGPDGALAPEVVSAVWSVARKLPGLGQLTKQEVAEALRGTPPPPPPVKPADVPNASPAPAPNGPGCDQGEPPSEWVSIAEPSLETSRRRPAALRMPDGSESIVKAWKFVTLGIVEWLVHHAPKPIPTPFRISEISGVGHLVHTEPVHRSGGAMDLFTRLPTPQGELCVCHGVKSQPLLAALVRLCREVGVDPAGVQARLAPKRNGDKG